MLQKPDEHIRRAVELRKRADVLWDLMLETPKGLASPVADRVRELLKSVLRECAKSSKAPESVVSDCSSRLVMLDSVSTQSRYGATKKSRKKTARLLDRKVSKPGARSSS